MVGLVEDLRATVFRTPLICQTGPLSSWPVHSRRFIRQLPQQYSPVQQWPRQQGQEAAPPLAQVLSDLFDALATLMAAEVDVAAEDQHNVEIVKVKDQIAQAKVDLAAENARMATERAELEAQA